MTKKGNKNIMKTINQGIVFSNDIQNILNGYNAINYSYTNNNLIIPNKNFIESLRQDFQNTVNKIFNRNTTIITEDDMKYSIQSSLQDIESRYPHHLTRSYLLR